MNAQYNGGVVQDILRDAAFLHEQWPTAVVYGHDIHPSGFGTQENPTRTWRIPQWARYMALGFLDPLAPLYDVYSGAAGKTPAPFAGPIDGATPVYGVVTSAFLPQVQG